MEKVIDKTAAKPAPAAAGGDESDEWDSFDGYDCKPPKEPFTKEYSDSLLSPGAKDAIAKRQAELKAAPGINEPKPKAAPTKS
jgi:hypothetical protein